MYLSNQHSFGLFYVLTTDPASPLLSTKLDFGLWVGFVHFWSFISRNLTAELICKKSKSWLKVELDVGLLMELGRRRKLTDSEAVWNRVFVKGTTQNLFHRILQFLLGFINLSNGKKKGLTYIPRPPARASSDGSFHSSTLTSQHRIILSPFHRKMNLTDKDWDFTPSRNDGQREAVWRSDWMRRPAVPSLPMYNVPLRPIEIERERSNGSDYIINGPIRN